MGDGCTIAECANKPFRRGLCHGHYWRHRNGKPVTGPLRHWGSPKTSLSEAIHAYADAETEEEFVRAETRLRITIHRATVQTARRAARSVHGKRKGQTLQRHKAR